MRSILQALQAHNIDLGYKQLPQHTAYPDDTEAQLKQQLHLIETRLTQFLQQHPHYAQEFAHASMTDPLWQQIKHELAFIALQTDQKILQHQHWLNRQTAALLVPRLHYNLPPLIISKSVEHSTETKAQLASKMTTQHATLQRGIAPTGNHWLETQTQVKTVNRCTNIQINCQPNPQATPNSNMTLSGYWHVLPSEHADQTMPASIALFLDSITLHQDTKSWSPPISAYQNWIHSLTWQKDILDQALLPSNQLFSHAAYPELLNGWTLVLPNDIDPNQPLHITLALKPNCFYLDCPPLKLDLNCVPWFNIECANLNPIALDPNCADYPLTHYDQPLITDNLIAIESVTLHPEDSLTSTSLQEQKDWAFNPQQQITYWHSMHPEMRTGTVNVKAWISQSMQLKQWQPLPSSFLKLHTEDAIQHTIITPICRPIHAELNNTHYHAISQTFLPALNLNDTQQIQQRWQTLLNITFARIKPKTPQWCYQIEELNLNLQPSLYWLKTGLAVPYYHLDIQLNETVINGECHSILIHMLAILAQSIRPTNTHLQLKIYTQQQTIYQRSYEVNITTVPDGIAYV